MAIITISRGSYSRGKEVAEKVAARLEYVCISRDILLDASEIFNASELKLERAIHNAPSLLDRFSNGKERYISYIKAALLNLFKEDNVVYHGLAGHFFVQGIDHAVKVRITADMEDRVLLEMERTGMDAKQAAKLLRDDDEQRRRWSLWLYGHDTFDPALYDMVVHLKRMTTDDAAEIICRAAKSVTFHTTTDSRQKLKDLALEAEVKAAIVETVADVEVHARDGDVRICAKVNPLLQKDVEFDLTQRVAMISGVRGVTVSVNPIAIFNG
jgi:cytidylate kinase